MVNFHTHQTYFTIFQSLTGSQKLIFYKNPVARLSYKVTENKNTFQKQTVHILALEDRQTAAISIKISVARMCHISNILRYGTSHFGDLKKHLIACNIEHHFCSVLFAM